MREYIINHRKIAGECPAFPTALNSIFPLRHYHCPMREERHGRFDTFRILLVLIPCLLFIYELVGYSRFAGWDVSRLNLPLKWFDAHSLIAGAMPLWNYYLYGGMPQLAESESGLFYPGNFLLISPRRFFLLGESDDHRASDSRGPVLRPLASRTQCRKTR